MGPPMKDRSENPLHHEQMLLPQSYISLLITNTVNTLLVMNDINILTVFNNFLVTSDSYVKDSQTKHIGHLGSSLRKGM